MSDAMTLPDDLVAWIGEVAGGHVTRCDRVPGGASREAWFVDVTRTDGTVDELFLRYSRSARAAPSAFHPLRVEAEIFQALHGTGVTVPRTLGVHPTHEAMLAERVRGATWFYRIKDPDEQVRVAQDFIRNLAALHRLDPSDLRLPSLGEVTDARTLALEEIGRMRARATCRDATIDPFIRVSLDWLERNVPEYDGPVVLVQGDTGPGNFMYEDGKVTAVVDWELAHLGDPMDDIAWLSLRTVQDTFTNFPDRLREYEELSGHVVDESRVWYYRLFAETRLSAERVGAGRDASPAIASPATNEPAPAAPVASDLGNGLIYGILHRRLSVEALAHVMGVELPAVKLPPPDPPEDWHRLYDGLLGNFQAIVPRIADPLANGWTKGAVRVIKYLKELDHSGRAFAHAELDDLADLLGRRPADLHEGRRALAVAVNDGRITDEDYLRYQWSCVSRDNHLLRTASGALAERTWPPLT